MSKKQKTETETETKTAIPGLERLVLAELRAHPWLVLSALLCVISALGVIYSTHQARMLITQREALRETGENAANQWRNLRLEQSALTEHSRIEALARDQGMLRPSPKEELVIRLP